MTAIGMFGKRPISRPAVVRAVASSSKLGCSIIAVVTMLIKVIKVMNVIEL